MRQARLPMLDRIPAVPVLVAWTGYCTAVSVIGASGLLDLDLLDFFLLFAPAQILLGLLVPRAWVIAAPIALTLVLGWLTFEVECPCHENGIGYFYVFWTYFFAFPGILLVGLGIAVRRVVVSAA